MTDNTVPIDVSDEVISVCAVNATLKTPGVYAMAGGLTDTISENILGIEAISKGIRVSQDDHSLEIDVHVIASYGAKIPQMAWDIQENVKKEINTMTGKTVSAVNIHVQGVETDDEK